MQENTAPDLAADQVDSPSVDQVSVDAPFVPEPEVDWDNPQEALAALEADGLLDDVLDMNRGIAPSTPEVSEAPEVVEEQVESEESPDEVETPAEESSEESPTEEDDVEEDEEVSPPSEDLNIIDISELNDNDVFEYKKKDGTVENLNWSEIHNRLRRSDSASNESREAKALQERLAEEEAAIAEERKFIRANVAQEQMHPALQQQLAEVQRLKSISDEKYQEQSLDYPFADREYQDALLKYNGMTQEYQSYVAQQQDYQAQQQRNKLAKLGVSHLVSDETARNEFTGYLKDNYDAESISLIRSNADLVKVAHDAMQWQKSQEKGRTRSVKKVPAKKSLKGGGKSVAQHSAQSKPKNTQGWATGGQLDPETDAVLDAYLANR